MENLVICLPHLSDGSSSWKFLDRRVMIMMQGTSLESISATVVGAQDYFIEYGF